MHHLKPNDVSLEARDRLKQTTNRSLDSQSFDRAWQRVYGTKEYRPSWIGSLPQPRPRPSKPSDRQKPLLRVNDLPLEEDEILSKFPVEEKQKVRELYDLQVESIPKEHRSKRIHEPLLLDGKVVPREKELGKWREMIELDEVDDLTGEPVYNRVVKSTNVPNWMNSNSYWRAKNRNTDTTFERMEQTNSPGTSRRLRESQVIHTAKYDLVGKYENKIAPADLKLEGKKELPNKRELKKWGDQLEIPQKLEVDDYISELDCTKGSNTGNISEKRRKFNSVLKQADVPGFFSYNNYWK